MVPSEGFKMLVFAILRDTTMETTRMDRWRWMASWDVRRSHLYGEARRWIYNLPSFQGMNRRASGLDSDGHVWNARRSANLVRSVQGLPRQSELHALHSSAAKT